MIGVVVRASQTGPSALLTAETGHFWPCAIIATPPAMKLIDVSVPLDANLPTYPGNTPFSLEPVQQISRGDHSNVSALHMSVHAGTHVDAPRHFLNDGPGADALPLEMLCGRTRVIEVSTRKGITPADLAGIDLSEDV